MSTLTITRGLPGAGKTTFARAECARSGAVRVNRDDTRQMMYGAKVGLDHKQEQAVTSAVHALAASHLRAGRDVIADDTNLRPAYVRAWRKLAREANAEFVVMELATPVAESIARQACRPEGDRVPAEVIERMAAKFMPKGAFLHVQDDAQPPRPNLYTPRDGTPTAILVDVDGTVALMGDRNPYDWASVGNDAPNGAVVEAVHALYASVDRLIFLSGRDESCRAATVAWLDRNVGLPYQLLMRPAGDTRRDSVVKAELFDWNVRYLYDVRLVLDDRDQVVRMWREMGLTCLQVADGNF